jgi:hypothetical protein
MMDHGLFLNQTKMKFRPKDYNSKKWLKWQRISGDHWGELNWQENYKDNFWKPRVYKIGSHLHYLACHAPINIRKKWYKNWQRFIKNYQKL